MPVYRIRLNSLLVFTCFTFAVFIEALASNTSVQSDTVGALPMKSNIKTSEIKLSSVIPKDSSEFNRADKKISAAVVSVFLGGYSSNGSSAHYFLDQNSQLEVSHLAGRREVLDIPESIMTGWQEFKMSMLSTGYKRYLGNSFYVKSLVSLRKVNFDKNFNGLLFWAESVGNYSFEAETIDLSLTIGNQWQWDYFTIGFDWIGYSVPISSRIKRDQGSGEIVTDPSYEDFRKSVKKTFTKDSWASILALSIGATF